MFSIVLAETTVSYQSLNKIITYSIALCRYSYIAIDKSVTNARL